MLFTLETGNRHKSHIFKEYKSSKWLDASPSGYFYLYTLSNGFFYEAVLDADKELLLFRQISADMASPLSFEPLTPFPLSFFVYKPQILQLVPEAFADTINNPLDERCVVHKTTFPQGNIDLLLFQSVSVSSVPSKLHVHEISEPELLIKLFLKGIWKAPSSHALLVSRFEEGFHLVLTDNQKILFANTFRFTAYEEVLYFCLQVLKDYDISQESCTLLYSLSDYSDTVVDFWKPYFQSVTAIDTLLPLPKVTDSVPFSLESFALFLASSLCE